MEKERAQNGWELEERVREKRERERQRERERETERDSVHLIRL